MHGTDLPEKEHTRLHLRELWDELGAELGEAVSVVAGEEQTVMF